MRRFAIVLFSSLVATAALPSLAAPTAASPSEPASAPGQLLVGYDAGTPASERADARRQASAKLLERVVAGRAGQGEVELVQLPGGANRDAAIRRFENHPSVTYAEPNWVVTTAATSDDPAYTGGSLWGMYGDETTPTNQYGSQAGEAWAAGGTGSPSVVVGVIDTGVDISHPDLAANIWTNPGEVGGNSVDDDGNGFVDDVHGWDFHNGDATVYDAGDGDNHGTHVAGTIAGVGGNGTGVAGVAWSATMIPVKFLGPNGGYTSNAVKAVNYLTDLKTSHGVNVVASNNSWGGGGYSTALYDAIEAANDAGVLFVAAAGNGGRDGKGDNNDSTPHYPSSYPNSNIIAVASITSSGAKSGFSNYGSTSVDLGAPGSGIHSTLPDGTYGTYSGTSMATPHVTGGAVLAAASGLRGDAVIKDAIFAAVVPTSSMGQTVTKGRLNVSGFVPNTTGTATAVDDGYVASEDQEYSVLAPGVLGNDTDASAAVLATNPSHGALSLASNGSFTYTPDLDFAGTDSFTYQAADGDGLLSAPATVTITVSAVNDAPVAVADAYDATVSTPLTVSAPGVLTNDTDVDSVSLSAALVADSAVNGSVSLLSDGSFTFTPATGFVGTASFQYSVSDGSLSSDAVTVSIRVAEAVVDTSKSSAVVELDQFGGKTNTLHLDIRVRVVDANGGAVSGATVTATINGSSRTATSDSSGLALLASYRNAPTGCYSVSVVKVVSSPEWDGVSDTDEVCI